VNLIVLLVAWLLGPMLAALAASTAPTQAVALALAGIVAIFSPLLLKYVPLAGAQMTALTMLVALGVALLASWLTGELTLTREGIVSALLSSTALWTVQQVVYAALKQVAPTLVETPRPGVHAPVARGPAPPRF
jgi:hypothetical protein